MLLTNPLYLASILLLLVVVAEWLSQKKYFHFLGSSLLVIIMAAILANLGVIPSSQNAPPLYTGIFSYIAPLGIFYLLLDVKLKDVRKAGLPMLSVFLMGSVFTIVGVVASYYLLSPQHQINKAFAISGMFTATYIGGSANLNAVALHYDIIKEGTLFAAINAADNIISAIWIVITLMLPSILQKWFPRQSYIHKLHKPDEETVLPIDSAKEDITITGFSLLLALGVISLFFSQMVNKWVPQIPSIIILTTMALILGQIKAFHKLRGGNILGFLFVLLFLAVVGAFCDISALLKTKEIAVLLMVWVTIIVFVHGILLYLAGGIFRQDWTIVSIASNAAIGGPTTAGVLATSLNRPELRLPAILVGTVGYAIGTYLGVVIAEYLR